MNTDTNKNDKRVYSLISDENNNIMPFNFRSDESFQEFMERNRHYTIVKKSYEPIFKNPVKKISD